jgi:DHA3 family macrolide efflux protein-like MFS transporter
MQHRLIPMRTILQQRPLRLIFTANLISMLGSGMNSAAVTWYLLQATHNEMALGTLVMLTTIPALLMLPFTGVIIDREDRRRLVMLLDAGRAVIILVVAVLALRGQVHIWQLYLMNTLVAAGFWMFWPTVTALVQELTPESEFLHSNTFLLAGVQGGWLLAGAVVGFIYNHVGLGGVLLIDFSTYVVSFSCYLLVRKGRHVVKPQAKPAAHHLAEELHAAETAVSRFWHELREGVHYILANRYLLLLGTSWFLFIGGMMAQGVLTAPLSDRVLHAGAVGYGWLNGGWGVGAFLSTLYSAWMIRRFLPRRSIAVSMALMAIGLYVMPFFPWLAIAVLFYAMMGSARGVGGVAISATIMEIVPKHFMGRVQNTFLFAGTLLQLLLGGLVGMVAHRVSLAAGFGIVGTVYLVASLTAVWPAGMPTPLSQPAAQADGDAAARPQAQPEESTVAD